jgi:uncharacterized membrane protein
MNKTRLEAFSDGVIAIIITIMVLELKIPHGADWQSLRNLAPKFVSYVISFIYIAIYWNNHHHLLHTVKHVTGSILWANIHLLFWLSLVPFVTAWAGENHFAELPVAVYSFVMLMAGVAYFILSRFLIKVNGKDSLLSRAVGRDLKGIISMIGYAVGVPLAFVFRIGTILIIIIIAFLWLIPDTRIEKKINETE